MRRPEALVLLGQRQFATFFWGRTISTIGSSMAGIAITFAVLDLDGSAGALGLVLAARTIPMVVFMLFGGVVADRFSRSLVMQVSHLLSAATQGAVAVLLLTGIAELWMIVVLEALNGVVAAFTFPALTTIVPLVTPRDQIQQANALLGFSRGTVVVMGPAVGAFIAVTFGSGWAVAVDAASFGVAALLMARLRLPPAAPADTARRASMARDLAEGWSAFCSLTWVWVVVVAFSALNMIQSGALYTLGPVIAVDTVGKQTWGWALSAQAAGLLLMTLWLMRKRLSRPVRSGMIGICAVSLPIFALAVDARAAALVAMFFVAGAGTEVFSIGWQSAYHQHVPNEVMSRISAYDWLGSLVAMPLGQLAYGPLARVFDPTDVLVFSGIAYVAIALSTLLSRSVRDLPGAQPPTSEAPDTVAG